MSCRKQFQSFLFNFSYFPAKSRPGCCWPIKAKCEKKLGADVCKFGRGEVVCRKRCSRMIKGLKKLQKREEKKEIAVKNLEMKSKEQSSREDSTFESHSSEKRERPQKQSKEHNSTFDSHSSDEISEDASERRLKSRKQNKKKTKVKPRKHSNEKTKLAQRKKGKGKISGKKHIWRAKKTKQHSSWEDVPLPQVQYDQPSKQSKETSSSEEAAETASSEESTIEKMVREENEKPLAGEKGVKLKKGKKLSHKQLKMLVQAAAERKKKSNNPLCREPSEEW